MADRDLAGDVGGDGVPAAAKALPAGMLESAIAGAQRVETVPGGVLGRTTHARLAHALLQLQRDGWVRVRPEKVGPALLNVLTAGDHLLACLDAGDALPEAVFTEARLRVDQALEAAWEVLRPGEGRPARPRLIVAEAVADAG